MLRWTFMGLTILSVISFAVPSVRGQETADNSSEPAVAHADPADQFAELLAQWKGLLDRLRELQNAYRIAEPSELDGIRQQYNQLIDRGNRMMPQLRSAAVDAYKLSPNADPELSRFLVTMIADEIRSDNYEPARMMAKVMMEGRSSAPELPNLAGIAAFATHDFVAAQQYLEEARKTGTLSAAGEQYLSDVADYVTLWEKEKQVREEEALADDLPRVKLTTSKGEIVIELFENEAPQAVANFISLVEKGFYDGVTFHRVLPGFMAQGGCPKGDGTGDPGYNIYCECYNADSRKHFRGSLSMAHAGRNTGGSQFFLTFVPTPHLNGAHTVFGRVIEGIEVLAKLQRIDPQVRTPTLSRDKIVSAVVLRKREHDYAPTVVQ